MNTRKPTKQSGRSVNRRTGRRTHACAASPNASHTTKHYSQLDHLARIDFDNSTGSMRKGNRMDTETGGELITVQEAADRLAVSRWMVYQLIWDQQVKSVQIGRCRRIVRQSFEDYLSGLIEGAA